VSTLARFGGEHEIRGLQLHSLQMRLASSFESFQVRSFLSRSRARSSIVARIARDL
jgi:hypothetical protein